MSADVRSEKSVFFHALDIESPGERAAFIEGACRGDAELLENVWALLRAHEREGNPIDRPLVANAALPKGDVGETEVRTPKASGFHHEPGSRIGPYKLMEQIGEGGFGLVYVADQQEPVRRRVALKIIKPGMESREVLTRFEAERQAIAMMDHPNIARVFDAGVTDNGQPYFVMELVRGVPLTAFCDGQKLDAAQRLRLFITICHAVQHAHQKGIIHRDLKPSNILVTLQDGEPLAKVIDFGVAKAIGQSLTAKTIYTRFASMIGTPAYMSPEQAEISNVDVDTRSDIYSLGVLLYELLTGSPPFAPDRLQSAAFDELRRIIREEEPPRPSTRLSTLNDEQGRTIAANRRLERTALATSLKRDLDWIVMKALDKDRNRRYASAGSLAQDLLRYLSHQPVEARPPSASYRLTKFAKRNKVALCTASLVAGALVLGTIVSIWLALVAMKERDEKGLALREARAAEASANKARTDLEEFTERLKASNVLLASGRGHADEEHWAEAHRAYTEATEAQPKYFLAWLERGRLNVKLGRWKEGAGDFARALEFGCPVSKTELVGVPQLLFNFGELAAYRQLCNDLDLVGDDPFAVAIRARLVGDISPSPAAELATKVESMMASPSSGNKHKYAHVLSSVYLYIAGWAHLRAGDLERAVERLEASHGENANWLGRGIGYPLLAVAYHRAGRADDALRAFEKSEEILGRWLDESVSQEKGSPPIPWVDWIEFLSHHREASILVKGHTPAIDPRLEQMERFANLAIE